MTTTPQYEKLVRQLKTELPALETKVLDTLTENPAGVTRIQLVTTIYGTAPVANLSMDKRDRKIRRAIESLRKRFVPIISSSGGSGYRIDASTESIDAMIGEWESRIAEMRKQVNAARKFYQRDYVQPELLEAQAVADKFNFANIEEVEL